MPVSVSYGSWRRQSSLTDIGSQIWNITQELCHVEWKHPKSRQQRHSRLNWYFKQISRVAVSSSLLEPILLPFVEQVSLCRTQIYDLRSKRVR